jgi:hypothetical protein
MTIGRCPIVVFLLHRVAAWLSVPALILASWTPGEHMIRTGVNGRLEHPSHFGATR